VGASVWSQISRIGSLTTLSELSEILLRLQLLLTKADLSVLAAMRSIGSHHASVM